MVYDLGEAMRNLSLKRKAEEDTVNGRNVRSRIGMKGEDNRKGSSKQRPRRNRNRKPRKKSEAVDMHLGNGIELIEVKVGSVDLTLDGCGGRGQNHPQFSNDCLNGLELSGIGVFPDS